MKKYLAALLTALLLLCMALSAGAVGPALTATEAYCILDADTGLVLAQQNMDEELHPASITKVMTLGLACAFSQARARVITLVMEAGCSSSFIFCWASTRPVSASMMPYARVALSAGPAAAAPGISTRIISSTAQSAVVSFFIWFSPSGSLAARRAAPAGYRF